MMRQIAAAEADDIPPEGGRFVKSLNSDGASWIVTDFYPDSDTQFTFSFNNTAYDVGYENFYGAAGYTFRAQHNTSNTAINGVVITAWGSANLNVTLLPDGDHVIYVDRPGAKIIVDNKTTNFTAETEYSISQFPLLIFAMGAGKTGLNVDRPGTFKLYEANVKQNGALTHKWRPAIDGDGVACLYDTVTQKCLYNAGTGTFTFDE